MLVSPLQDSFLFSTINSRIPNVPYLSSVPLNFYDVHPYTTHRKPTPWRRARAPYIDGMEPYDTFFKRITRAIFHRWEDPILVTLDDRNTPFTSWEMAQIVVSVLHNLPTILESKEERNWVVKHFQLREESTQDPDHIVLPTNGSVLCYRHELGDEFVPVTRLDAMGKASYVAHNEAGHDYLKKESTFVIVDSTNRERVCPIMDFARYCPTCIKTAEENRPSIPNRTAVPARKFSRQQIRMLSVERDDDDDDDNDGGDEEEEEEKEEADLYSWNEAIYYQEPSVTSLSRRSSLDSIASDVISETTASNTMWSNEDGYFDMAPPTILDDDDDVPASQAMLDIENSGYVRRDSDPPSDD